MSHILEGCLASGDLGTGRNRVRDDGSTRMRIEAAKVLRCH